MRVNLSKMTQKVIKTIHLSQKDFIYACFFEETSSEAPKDELIGLVTRKTDKLVNLEVLKLDLCEKTEPRIKLLEGSAATQAVKVVNLKDRLICNKLDE